MYISVLADCDSLSQKLDGKSRFIIMFTHNAILHQMQFTLVTQSILQNSENDFLENIMTF